MDLFQNIKDAITLLENIHLNYTTNRCIFLNAHHIFFRKIFNKPLSTFYEKYPNIQISIQDDLMKNSISKLLENEIDIIISKKHDIVNNHLEFIKLGILNNILVVKKDSKLLNKEIDIELLYTLPFITPSRFSGTTKHFFNTVNCKRELFKNLTYTSHEIIADLLKNATSDIIALITKEFIQEELNSGEFIELNTTIKIPPLDYGIYINKSNKFKELNTFINFLKQNLI